MQGYAAKCILRGPFSIIILICYYYTLIWCNQHPACRMLHNKQSVASSTLFGSLALTGEAAYNTARNLVDIGLILKAI